MAASSPLSELTYLDYGIAGILLIAVGVLFRLYISERNKNDTLQISHKKEVTDLQAANKKEVTDQQTAHKEEMKALLYELVADARERGHEYLQVADRITSVLESLEKRVTKSERRR